MKWILASKSPRRRELLGRVISDFDIMVSDANESYWATEPDEIVKELAKLKCDAICAMDETVIISSDTIVWSEGEVLGKPKDKADCERMIRRLSGKVHQVYTGVCVRYYFLDKSNMKLSYKEDIIAEKTDVYVDSMTDAEIYSYINSDEPYDKAGGYGIQGEFSKYISRIDGDYYNVMGFPVNAFYKLVKQRGYI